MHPPSGHSSCSVAMALEQAQLGVDMTAVWTLLLTTGCTSLELCVPLRRGSLLSPTWGLVVTMAVGICPASGSFQGPVGSAFI